MAWRFVSLLTLLSIWMCCARPASAQIAPPPPPPPRWDVAIGGSFVGTSGNSDTSTVGADFSTNHRWPRWQIEAAATAVATSDDGTQTAERYFAAFRGKRQLSPIVSLSGGERVERDTFAGTALRSILDGGVGLALVRRPRWTLDSLTALGWNREDPVDGPAVNHPVGVLQAINKILFDANGTTTQRFTYFPDFESSSDYRFEAELAAQAALNSRLALKLGYLWRYSNAPIAGFVKSDNTTTASVVIGWKATTPAP